VELSRQAIIPVVKLYIKLNNFVVSMICMSCISMLYVNETKQWVCKFTNILPFEVNLTDWPRLGKVVCLRAGD